MLCHTENMAPGTVAMARPENAVAARLVARPEFCMPISMERNIAITSTFTVVRSSKYVIAGVKHHFDSTNRVKSAIGERRGNQDTLFLP